MKPIKSLFLIFSLIINLSISLAQDVKSYYCYPISTEKDIATGNTFYLKFKIGFTDSVLMPQLSINVSPQILYYEIQSQNYGSSNHWFTSSGSFTLDSGLYIAGDTIIDSILVTINKNVLPYSYRNLRIQLLDDSSNTVLQANTFIWFTPYQTAEIWNREDFDKLKRIWDSPEEADYTNKRVSMSKDSIPVSNVSDSDFNTDTLLFQYVSKSGLPFSIPYLGLSDLDSNINYTGQMMKKDNCGGNKQRYKGVISGNLKSFFIPGNEAILMPMSGSRVYVYDKDYGLNPDDCLGWKETDDDGTFEIEVNSCQNFQGINQPEGNDLELYFVIKTINSQEDIRVRSRLGKTKEFNFKKQNTINWAYNNGQDLPIDVGTILSGTDSKSYLQHYSVQCQKFVENSISGFNLSAHHRLEIMPSPWPTHGDFMLPGGMKAAMLVGSVVIPMAGLTPAYIAANFTNDNGIYRNFDDDFSENTACHEFGHYVMWELQGNSFNTQLPFHEHSLSTNSFQTKLAWSEGWAEGFGQIMDIVLRNTDGEAGLDGFNFERRSNDGSGSFEKRPEDFEITVIRGGLFNRHTSTENTVAHGYLSELNIACMLVDLYDGVNTPNIIAATPQWDDAGVWTSSQTDKVSLTFAQIAQPLRDHQGSFWLSNNVVQNVNDYGSYLIQSLPCDLRGNVKRVFIENRISNFSNPPTNQVNSDLIKVDDETLTHPTYKFVGTHKKKKFETNVQFIGDESEAISNLDVNTITSSDGFYNLGGFTNPNPLTNLDINDNLDVMGGTLFLNNSGVDGGFRDNPIADPEFITYTANVCAEKIKVFNNGLLEIGDDGGSDKATMIIKSNSTLSLNNNTVTSQPSIIRVNNNSKLVIEGTLEIFPNSRIILNGDNAILEIKGVLDIKDGATFTYEGGTAGSGHVVFNTTSKNNIILGTASKIKFVGANTNDRVMEVMADYMFWPDNAQLNSSGSPINANASFEIQNGLVALGHDAILNIGTAITLNNVRFYAEAASKAKGIVLWGQKHSIENVLMENVAGGIQSYNNVGGYPLTMKNVTITGADNALYSEGKGATLTSFHSDNNPNGITINASIWPNKFNAPHINGATTLATRYKGGATSSNLVISKANYHDNYEGVNFAGLGTMVLSCGRFHNVAAASGGTAGNAITQKFGTFIASDALGFIGGRVSFKDNKNTIVFNKVRPYINNGWNDFSYLSSSAGLNVALNGQLLLKLPGHVLNAGYNLWDGTNIPGSLCPTLSGSYQNYNLKYQRTLAAPLYCVNIPTSSIINAYQFEVSHYNRCITMPGGWFPADKGTIGTALVINTTHFYNTNLQDAVGLILDQMHDTLTTDYDGVIDLWAELLTEPEYAFPLSDDDYYYIELAENKMMETLGMLLSRDTTLETSESGQSHFETVMDAQAYWISSVENETDTLSVMLKTIFNFDKGMVYHLEGENSSAQSQWSTMQSWCNDDYLEHTDYWLCQIAREAAIKACGNNPDSIANIPECQYSEGENQFTMKDPTLSEGSVIKEDNKISKRLTIYPNPASTLVTAELETTQNETATIAMYSADGKCIKTLPTIKLHIGTNKLSIPIFDIAQGVYTITIETNTVKWNDKVIIK